MDLNASFWTMRWAYCFLAVNFVIIASSSTLSLLLSVNAADVKPISQSLHLQCPPCEKIHCSPRNMRRLRCKGGITRGVCNCCPVCAKLVGELCGGQWNYLGKCDRGLRCESQSTSKNDFQDLLTPDNKKTWIAQGRCVKVLAHEAGYNQMDQPVPAYCRPKCTPEFCSQSPRAVCSAIDNAEKSHSCHGDCQHTSCRACQFVQQDQGCGKCRTDDFQCLKQFGKCVKQDFCSRKKYPCRISSIMTGLTFQCKVPECLTP